MRQFRSVNHSGDLRSHYDAVVIGGGIGGLTCANLLVREGVSVLLVEQHYMIGGYCSTFRRKGYTFDAATHFYPLLGNPGTITGRILRTIGSRTRWVKMDPVDRFHFPDGSSFDVPAGFHDYRGRLAREFPAEEAALDRFFALVQRTYVLGVLEFFEGRSVRWLDRYRDRNLQEVLDEHFESPKLKLLLTADCPHWGSPPSRISFVFDSMLRVSYFLGNYYPVGGSQAFADDLAARLEDQRGHILMRSDVRRIVVEGGRAVGIEVETGSPKDRRRVRIAADVVVSNADMLQTVDRLLPQRNVDPALREKLTGMRTSYPCFLSHIGLRDTSTDLLKRIHGYYWDEWDADACGTTALRFKLFVPTALRIAHGTTERPRSDSPEGPEDRLRRHRRLGPAQVRCRGVCHGRTRKADPGPPRQDRRRPQRVSPDLAAFHPEPIRCDVGMGDGTGPTRHSPTPDPIVPSRASTSSVHWARPGGGITPVMVSAQKVAAAILGSSTNGESTLNRSQILQREEAV